MGGLAAVFLDRGATIDGALFDRICAAVPCRASGGMRTWSGDGAAIARLSSNSTDPDPAPVVDERRHLVVAFDGRLDNREEIAGALRLDASVSDARLALEAVAAWDVAAPARLLGDFAFITWDARARRLLLARDHMGLRPLHYTLHGGLAVCGSDIAHVLAHPSLPRRPDTRVAAEYLACAIRNGPDTLYAGVSRVPPGHCVRIEDGAARIHRYWSVAPSRPIRYRSDDEYAAHCRDLLVRSVSARMRGDAPVAATLSGGIDSSVVALTAHLLIRGAPPPRLFSLVFPDHPDADERRYIDAVAAQCGTVPELVAPGAPTKTLASRAATWMNAPSMASDHMAERLWTEMHAQGYRVALTGAGGDYVYAGSIFHYADLLRGGRLLGLIKRYRDDRVEESGRGPLAWMQAGVWPALPSPLKRRLRPVATWTASRAGIVRRCEWLRLPVEHDEQRNGPRRGSYAVEELASSVTGGVHSYVLEGAERAAAEAGLELRHPLLDPRLTEFALAIPEEQRRRGPILKYVLRRALRDELPEIVATRTSKGEFSHYVWDTVTTLGGEAFYRSLAIADAGWVDADRVVELYRRMESDLPRGPRHYGRYVPEIWMITAVESWFRAAFGVPKDSAI